MVKANVSDMYKLNPIVPTSDQISLPTCMYRLKMTHEAPIFNVYSSTNAPDTNYPDITNQKPYKDLAMLEARQERLLQQLEFLRIQMLSMKQNLQSSVPVKTSAPSAKKSMKKADLPCDVVIKASPSYPPYSLLSLCKLINLKVSCHTHSTVLNLPKAAIEFTKEICSNNIPSSVEMTITLIWKEVGINTELITCSTMPVVICGEVNILRYIVAAVPSQLGYKHLESAWETDSLLDTCHRLQNSKTSKERQSLIRLLNTKLGKQQWIGGSDDISVVDLAAWSIITQGEYQNDLSVNMKNWIQRCNDWMPLSLVK